MVRVGVSPRSGRLCACAPVPNSDPSSGNWRPVHNLTLIPVSRKNKNTNQISRQVVVLVLMVLVLVVVMGVVVVMAVCGGGGGGDSGVYATSERAA